MPCIMYIWIHMLMDALQLNTKTLLPLSQLVSVVLFLTYSY